MNDERTQKAAAMNPNEVVARLEASRPGDDMIGYTSAAEAMWDLLHHRHSVLPKLVFYIRFFINHGNPRIGSNMLFVVDRSEMDLFDSGGDGHGVLGERAEERLWRMVMESRLSEWTGCGHFASVMRHNLYFASREEEERAASQTTFTTPARLLDHLDSTAGSASEVDLDEGKGLVIRVEFSAYDADEWDLTGRGAGPKPDARDFHAYLIDIPSAGRIRDLVDDGDDQEPAAYVVQSLWEHYDVSVRPISAGDLRRHLRFLALFDGRTQMANGERCRLTHPSFWDVPLPRTKGRPRPSSLEPYLGASLDALLGRLESQHDQKPHDEVVVSVLDVFSVEAYDSGETKRRLVAYMRQALLADGGDLVSWGEQTLPYGPPNLTSSAGPPRRAWSEVLSAVDRVHAATEAKQKKKAGILPLVDFLPSPHLDTKHRYRSSPASDDVALLTTVIGDPGHTRRGERKGRDGATKQRSRCTLS